MDANLQRRASDEVRMMPDAPQIARWRCKELKSEIAGQAWWPDAYMMGGVVLLAQSTEHTLQITDQREKSTKYWMKIAEQRIQGTDYKITVFAWYEEYRLQSKEYRGGWCI